MIKELDGKYPERSRRSKTYLVDFGGIESVRSKPLNDFEKECITAISFDHTGTMRLTVDFNVAIDKFPNSEKVIIQKRIEGWTEQEIADFLNNSRRTVIRKIHKIFNKMKKALSGY